MEKKCHFFGGAKVAPYSFEWCQRLCMTDRDTHQELVLPAQLQVPALPAAVEPLLPGQHWPDAQSAAQLLAHQGQMYEGQLRLTAPTGLNKENEIE